jgi:hypothetical protein
MNCYEALSNLKENPEFPVLIIAGCIRGWDTDSILRSMPDCLWREIIFLAHHEKIVHRDDFVLKRSMLGMPGHLCRETVAELADRQACPVVRRVVE